MSQRMDPIYETDEATEKPRKTKFYLPWEVLGSGIQLRNILGDFFGRKNAGNEEMAQNRIETTEYGGYNDIMPRIPMEGGNTINLDTSHNALNADRTEETINEEDEYNKLQSIIKKRGLHPDYNPDLYSTLGEYQVKPFLNQAEFSGGILPEKSTNSSISHVMQPSEEELLQRHRTFVVPTPQFSPSNDIQQIHPQIKGNDLREIVSIPQNQPVSMVPQLPPLWFYTEHQTPHQQPPPPPPPLPTQPPQQSPQQHFYVYPSPPREQLWHHPPHHPADQLLPQPLQPHPMINRQPTFFSHMPFSFPFLGGNDQRQSVSHPPSVVPHGMYVSHPRISSFPPPHQPPPFQHPYGNFVQPQPPYHMQSHQQPWAELSEMTKMIRRITP